MTMTKYYKVLTKDGVQTFGTNLTEKEFFMTLDGVYGVNNYSILEISY